jgi:hypothetical protein
MAFTDTWSETTPSDATYAKDLDDEIVKAKRSLRERLAVEHDLSANEGSSTTIGQHKQGSARIGFGLAGSKPSNNPTNPGALYVEQSTGGDPEKIVYDNGSEWKTILDIVTALKDIADNWKKSHPIGSLYFNAAVATNPATLLGFGTWVAYGVGRVLVGVSTEELEFASLGQTGGEKYHVLTPDEMPAHLHGSGTFCNSANANGIYYGVSGIYGLHDGNSTGVTQIATTSAGGSAGHINLQPYVTVYVWKRTA